MARPAPVAGKLWTPTPRRPPQPGASDGGPTPGAAGVVVRNADGTIGELPPAVQAALARYTPALPLYGGGNTRFQPVYVGDVADAATRQRLVERVASTWGGLDVLINNAGVGAVGPFAEATEQRLRQVMEVNFFAPAELTRVLLPWLRRGDRPLVVNVGSILSRVAMPKKSEYCASKFALRGWNHALQAELRPEGIQVLLVGPNTTRSEFFDRLLDQHGPVAKNPWSTPPETVARRLLRAARRRNSQELMLTFSGRALILLDFCCPALLRHLLARWG